MNYKQYSFIVKNVSSEMFYSLMALLHDKLPCAQGYFKLRNEFKRKNRDGSKSPIRTIAEPNMIKSLSPLRKFGLMKSEEISRHEANKSREYLKMPTVF